MSAPVNHAIMTSDDITKVLEAKHAEDVFVSECKNGPTVNGLLKLDGWVMKKSWAKPLTIGYEIKVSRSDFIRDDKWPGYLKYCNQFFFVCPEKLITPEEVGPEAGLMWVSCNRAITKKVAPYRDVKVPEELFRYILMCRARITRDTFHAETFRRDQWRDWLAKKADNRELGWQVSRAIKEHVSKVECENVRLWRENLEEKAKRLHAAVPPELKQSLRSAYNALDAAIKSLSEMEHQKQ